MHSTVVGDSEAVHAQFFGPGKKLGNAAHAIKQAVLGMNVEMSEFLWHFQNYTTGFPALPSMAQRIEERKS